MRSTLALGLIAVVGCYDAEFDAGASSVFACATVEECPTNQFCVQGVCVSDESPRLSINGPEDLQVLAAGRDSFPLTLASTGELFTLGPPGTGDGHVRVWVDGVEIGDPIVEGSLNSGVSVSDVPIPEPLTGPHRIRALVLDPSGEPYPNPSAAADRVFFVADPDGNPQIALVEPFPRWADVPLVARDVFEVGQPFDLVIAKNGVTWVDPREDMTPGEGHTHVYTLADYPECQPGCNYNYVASIKPSNSTSTDTRKLAGLAEIMIPTEPGLARVSAGLQWNNHFPFPAPTDLPSEWDEAMFDDLVTDSISVEFFDP